MNRSNKRDEVCHQNEDIMNKKPEKFNTQIDKYRRKTLDYLKRPYDSLSPSQKFWLGFASLCLITTLLINNPFWRPAPVEYKLGDIARESIISPADITQVDEEETRKTIEINRSAVLPIFRVQTNRTEQAVQTFLSDWETFQKNLNLQNGDEDAAGDVLWPGQGGQELGKTFASRRFSPNEIDSIVRVLRQSSEGSIYDDKDTPYLQSQITLIDPQKPNQESVVSMPVSNWIKLSSARDQLKKRLGEINSLSQTEVDAFDKALSPLIEPNVVYDSVATDQKREEYTKNIEPVKISLKRGQTIVREGDTITESVLSQIAAIRSYSKSSRQLNRFFGLLILVTALFWIAWKFIQHRGYVPRLSLSEEKTFALFGFVVIVQTLLMAIFFRVAEYTAAQNLKAPLNDPTLWALAIPFAFPSLLITLLADRRTAIFTGLFCSFVAGLLAPKGLEFTLYAAITSAMAVYGIGRYRSRQSVTTAGIMVGLSSAITAVALIAYTQQPFILNTVLLAICCGLASGLVAAAVTAVFLPLCETFFGILTDVKLLELSNADLPVLGQLALRAPGTNQHSHAVGQLAEEACRKVGANGLLARIGALYHDIGKTAAPEHFVENQRGTNPHDKLKPSQSARIIISHVTYGTKLAKDMGLPARIVDFIPQHHGTRTLHYFLTKAREEAGKGEEIVENDFRYPGPKPQFKEAAIMMIADSCEAASRSLSEPTPENIRFIVTKIIDAILADDQLDECDLTLRELTQIRETMIKSLVSIYHSRVDYPGYTPPSKSMQNIIIPDEDVEERGMRYKDPADIPIGIGGEVEDEAINRSIQPNIVEAKEEEEERARAAD
jgi:cyclic-di-AMP phosphodiesterase PgpH